MIAPAPTPSFRQLVRLAREAKQWTLAEAAQHCGYDSGQSWGNIESGQTNPPIHRLEAIADGLGLDLRNLFACWAQGVLKDDDSPALRRLISNWVRNAQDKNPEGPEAPLRDRLRTVSLDTATSDFVLGMVDQLIDYRRALTAPMGNPKNRKVVPLNDDLPWKYLPGSKFTMECGVGVCPAGLGYYATLIKIAARCGGYHKHVLGPFLDTVMEFFAVLGGHGMLFTERPTGSSWEVSEIRDNTVGHYPGSRGHAFVNLGFEPLILYVVSTPFPPLLLRDGKRGQKEDRFAIGMDFRLAHIESTDLPESLKFEIKRRTFDERKMCPSGELVTSGMVSSEGDWI